MSEGYIFALCESIEWNGTEESIIGLSPSFISEIVSVTLELITFHIKLVQKKKILLKNLSLRDDKKEIDSYLLWNPVKKIGKIIRCDLTPYYNIKSIYNSNGKYDCTKPFMVDLLKSIGWDMIVAEGEKPLKKVKLDDI